MKTKAKSIPALTLWQPWAWLVAKGLKKFETRSWKTDYQGPLLIHAAVKKPGMAAHEFWNWWLENGMLGADPPRLRDLPLGCIVAVAGLEGCRPTSGPDAFVPSVLSPEDCFGNWGRDRFGWELSEVKMLTKPIEATGFQKLWWPDEEIVEKVLRDIAPKGEDA